MYITLPEAKAHLRVDYDDDDVYIFELIKMAEEVIAVEIEEDLADLESVDEHGSGTGEIPYQLRLAILLVVGHFYNVREPVSVGVTATKIPMTVDYLIAPYKNWTVS
jgi:hypothetical protein